MQVNFPIVFVSDMARATAFYRDVLGLPLRFESPHWTEFGIEGTHLALHLAENQDAQPDDPEDMPAGRCRPGLSVPDLPVFHQRMQEHGVPCPQEPREVYGTPIALYLDPDGLPFSVSQTRSGG